MKDIARLEAQLESVDVKPRSKLSQRPKDTVPRDQTHSLSNIHPGRVKTVEKNKLFATCMHLKLLLQHRHITMDNIHQLIFNDLDLNEQVSIAELRDGFIDLGIPVSKALLMARYLIEPPTQGEVMFNEQAMSTQGEIVRELREIIGHYRLFKAEGYDIEDDTNYVAEEYMKKVVFETYGKKKEAFQESLHSEAVQGKLSLQDLYEALKSVDENADQVVIDYMLYSVYKRYLDTENLQVDHLLEMLNDAIKKQTRAQSASRKSRPESSSPEKIKMRNVHKQVVKDEDNDDEDDYSENIALDDGSGDDDIDKVEKNKKIDKSKAEPVRKDSDESSNEDNRMLDINALGKESNKEEDDDDDEYSDDNDEEDKVGAKKGLMRQTDHDNLEESHKLKRFDDEDDDDANKYGQDIDNFEESPRPKGPSNGVAR